MEILRVLLEISIYSAVIFAAVMLFKTAARGKVSPALGFALWFLLAARLCVPVTWDAGVTLFLLPPAAQEQQIFAGGQADGTPDMRGGPQMEGLPQNAGAAQNTAQGADTATGMRNAAGQPESGTTPVQPAETGGKLPVPAWPDALVGIWLAGAAALLCWTALVGARLARTVRKRAVPAPGWLRVVYRDCAAEAGVKNPPPLLVTRSLSSPALVASPRPRLLLPLAFAEGAARQKLRFALLHELTHFKRKDHWVCLLMRALCAVYWFNPVVWLADRQMVLDMETACDSAVVRRMQSGEKTRYANTVLELSARRREPGLVLGMALFNTKKVAERRIRGIYMKNKTKGGMKLAALLLVAVMGAACFTTACRPAREEAPETEQQAPPESGSTAPAASKSPVPLAETDTGGTDAVVLGQTDGVKIGTISDEANLLTGYDISGLDGQTGRDYQEYGYSTGFQDSFYNRRYNIWKASDLINGARIGPGETWSFNEAVGERTMDNGWKGAPSIAEGVYAEIPGGGVSQVATTLYNAALRAELEVVARVPSTWPVAYVPGGLDAAVSTGAPDLVLKNNCGVPVYLLARCDGGEDARTVEVSILRPAFEDGLTREFTSELVDEWTGKPTEVETPDETLPEGTKAQLIGEHKGRKYQVYKLLLDENGEEVSREPAFQTTYAYRPALFRVGTG